MSQPVAHRPQRNIHDSGRSRKIWVADLQADHVPSAGFEREDAVGHRDGGRLTDGFELQVEVWHLMAECIKGSGEAQPQT